MPSTLTIHPATPSDIPTLIAILFEAFANDKLLIGTCYPDTPSNRAFWVRSIQSQMRHEGSLVFKVVARYGAQEGADGEKIVGWAKWLVKPAGNVDGKAEDGGINQQEDGKKDVEERQGALDPSDTPSADMDMDACQKLADGQYDMLREVIGGRGCYWLNAIAVLPSYQRQGAATMLVAAGLKLADRDGLESFSACTTQANENMKGVLGRAGFKVVAERAVVGGLSVFAGYREGRKHA